LSPIEDTDALRIGTNWHRLQEIYGMKPGSVCPECAKRHVTLACPLCEGTDIMPNDMMDAVIRHLNQAYAERPMSKTPEEWETERIILLYSLVGYNWYYSDLLADDEIVAQEIAFRIPLTSPISNRALPHVVIDGRIDKILKRGNKRLISDFKSTGSSLDSDSTYWSHLNLDTQTTLYPFAIKSDYPDIGVLLDVWHKPAIRPKNLTQADTKKFIETGEYFGEKFEIEMGCDLPQHTIKVNGAIAEIKLGAEPKPTKKNPDPVQAFAIKETPEMYGARLLQDICDRPEYYFVQKPVARTDGDYKRFHIQLFNIYQTIRLMYKNSGWYGDESQCEAKFKCPYIPFCYNNITLKEGEIPDGFKRTYKIEDKIAF
ncbi:hypothetical protein LCGC14_2958900, partial [marine sediment metagenome]